MAKTTPTIIVTPTPPGLGELLAREQRPGPGARHDGNHWGLNRRGWAHGFYSNSGLERYDPKSTERQALERAARDAGKTEDELDGLSLDELLVLPELIEQLAGGISSFIRPSQPAATSREGLDTAGAVVLSSVVFTSNSAGVNQTRFGTAVRAPCALLSYAWSYDNSQGFNNGTHRFSIEGIGDVFAGLLNSIGSNAADMELGDGIVIRSGSLRTRIYVQGNSTVATPYNATLTASIQPLRETV